MCLNRRNWILKSCIFLTKGFPKCIMFLSHMVQLTLFPVLLQSCDTEFDSNPASNATGKMSASSLMSHVEWASSSMALMPSDPFSSIRGKSPWLWHNHRQTNTWGGEGGPSQEASHSPQKVHPGSFCHRSHHIALITARWLTKTVESRHKVRNISIQKCKWQVRIFATGVFYWKQWDLCAKGQDLKQEKKKYKAFRDSRVDLNVCGVDLQYGNRPAVPSVLWAVICFTRLTVSRSRCHPHGHINRIERVSKDTVWTGELHKRPGKQSLHHCEKLGKLNDNQYYHCQLLPTWGKDTL